MSKLNLKMKLSQSIEDKAVALSMLLIHKSMVNEEHIENLAKKIIRTYEIRKRVK